MPSQLKGAAYHRGIILAPQPATLGSILGITENLFQCC